MATIPHWATVHCKDKLEKLKVALGAKGLNTISTIMVIQTYGIHTLQKGHENVAVDALSRMHSAEVLFPAVSVIQIDILDRIKASYTLDPFLRHILQTCSQQSQNNGLYTLVDGYLRRKSKLVIGPNDTLRTQLL